MIVQLFSLIYVLLSSSCNPPKKKGKFTLESFDSFLNANIAVYMIRLIEEMFNVHVKNYIYKLNFLNATV